MGSGRIRRFGGRQFSRFGCAFATAFGAESRSCRLRRREWGTRRSPYPISDLACEFLAGALCGLLVALVLFTLHDIDDGGAVAASEDGTLGGVMVSMGV